MEATFNETSAATSRIYVAEQGIMIPNLMETLQFCWLHSSDFTSEKQPKNAKFLDFFPREEPLVATISKVCALTSRKNVSKPDISISDISDKLNFFGSTPPFLL